MYLCDKVSLWILSNALWKSQFCTSGNNQIFCLLFCLSCLGMDIIFWSRYSIFHLQQCSMLHFMFMPCFQLLFFISAYNMIIPDGGFLLCLALHVELYNRLVIFRVTSICAWYYHEYVIDFSYFGRQCGLPYTLMYSKRLNVS